MYSQTESGPSVSYKLTRTFLYPCAARSTMNHSAQCMLVCSATSVVNNVPGRLGAQIPIVSSSPPPMVPSWKSETSALPMFFLLTSTSA